MYDKVWRYFIFFTSVDSLKKLHFFPVWIVVAGDGELCLDGDGLDSFFFVILPLKKYNYFHIILSKLTQQLLRCDTIR
jgi:hypothetical protein